MIQNKKLTIRRICTIVLLQLFISGTMVFAQDTIIKFDQLIAKGNFININEDDGFPPNGTISIIHTDGTHTLNGRPYKEISRKWVQYKKMKIYTRDQFSQNGYKIWYQEMNDKKTEFDDLLEANYNPSIEKLKSGEVLLYATKRKVWVKLTDKGCYKGRKVVLINKIKHQQNNTSKNESNNKKVCVWCNQVRYHKIVCDYCNKELKIGNDYFGLIDLTYISRNTYSVKKSYMQINREDASECYRKGYFCNYEHAYKYGISKGYNFRD